jgi:hypothetical protein
MVARLVRSRHASAALARGVLPYDVPAAPNAAADGAEASDPKPSRARHGGRHTRTSGPPGPQRTSLSIRSAERRRWSADLARPEATVLVVHGLGGIGKSTLAAQIAARLSRLTPEQAVTVVSGEIAAASLVAAPAGTDLLVLDNFDDNLACESGVRTLRDPALADRLAGWTGRLLITCRTAFSLPPEHRDRFVFRHLGPLTRSGAAELALSLPALRLLDEPQRDLAWRLTAGHPRTMEYLDALLDAGLNFAELTVRMTTAIQARTDQSPIRAEPTELSEATADLIASAAGQQLFGELFDRLSSGAKDLLVRASVFRTPVAAGVLAARSAQVAECEAAGLLTPRPGRKLTVHRWTAAELHERLIQAGQAAQLGAAHRQAVGYWYARTATPQLGPRAQLEAAFHLRQVGELAVVAAAAPAPPERPSLTVRPAAAHASPDRRRLRRLGLASAAGVAAVFLAVEAANGLTASHLTAADHADHTAAPAALTQADAVRDRAAAWVASQVSTGAIVACDQAMCSLLVRHGFPAANLLVLAPGAPDPLGSALVVATGAVRDMFGGRLATVYAPQIVASFGTGPARIDMRAVAPDGAAAYRSALAADLQARRAAGLQLLADPQVSGSASARADLAAGRVDARLLITLAAMAHTEPVRILAFGGDGPGAGPGTPARTAELAAPPATAQAMLAFVRAQRPPYLAAGSSLSQGVLSVEFSAPSPLGLLQPPS